jgi:hypothetical protein
LGAARLANTGQLDSARLATLAREAGPGLRVLTGLPRAERWAEVRPPAFDRLLELTRTLATYTVLDTGFAIEQEPGAGFDAAVPRRNHMTLAALDTADEVILVGSADAVGLARLARSLVELADVVPGCTLRVVVNRVRGSLGWGETQIRGMVEGFVVPRSIHFLPDDRAAADRALAEGKSLVESGNSPLRRALAQVADSLDGVAGRPGPGGLLRRRRAGAAR